MKTQSVEVLPAKVTFVAKGTLGAAGTMRSARSTVLQLICDALACSMTSVTAEAGGDVAAYFTLKWPLFCHFFTKNRCILKDFG